MRMVPELLSKFRMPLSMEARTGKYQEALSNAGNVREVVPGLLMVIGISWH